MFNSNIVQKPTTITKYIKKTYKRDSSSFKPKDSLTNSSEMRTNLCVSFSDCKSLVKSALYSWHFFLADLSYIKPLILKVVQNCVYIKIISY